MAKPSIVTVVRESCATWGALTGARKSASEPLSFSDRGGDALGHHIELMFRHVEEFACFSRKLDLGLLAPEGRIPTNADLDGPAKVRRVHVAGG